ncbi:hypothetical protein ACFL0W_04795 [Nanoarchaeota archaeon]
MRFIKQVAIFMVFLIVTLPFYISSAYAYDSGSFSVTEVSSESGISAGDAYHFRRANYDRLKTVVEGKNPLGYSSPSSSDFKFAYGRFAETFDSCSKRLEFGLNVSDCEYLSDHYDLTAGFYNYNLRFDAKTTSSSTPYKLREEPITVVSDGLKPIVKIFKISKKITNAESIEFEYDIEDKACASCGDVSSGIKTLQLFDGGVTPTVYDEIALNLPANQGKAYGEAVVSSNKLGNGPKRICLRADDNVGNGLFNLPGLPVVCDDIIIDNTPPVIVLATMVYEGTNKEVAYITPGLNPIEVLVNISTDYAGFTQNNVYANLFGFSGPENLRLSCTKIFHFEKKQYWQCRARASIKREVIAVSGGDLKVSVEDDAGNRVEITESIGLAVDASDAALKSIGTDECGDFFTFPKTDLKAVINDEGVGLENSNVHISPLDDYVKNPGDGKAACSQDGSDWICVWKDLEPRPRQGDVRLTVTTKDDLGVTSNFNTGNLKLDTKPPEIKSSDLVFDGFCPTSDTNLQLKIIAEDTDAQNMFVQVDAQNISTWTDLIDAECTKPDEYGTEWECLIQIPEIVSEPRQGKIYYTVSDCPGNKVTGEIDVEVCEGDYDSVPNFINVTVGVIAPISRQTLEQIDMKLFVPFSVSYPAEVSASEPEIENCIFSYTAAGAPPTQPGAAEPGAEEPSVEPSEPEPVTPDLDDDGDDSGDIEGDDQEEPDVEADEPQPQQPEVTPESPTQTSIPSFFMYDPESGKPIYFVGDKSVSPILLGMTIMRNVVYQNVNYADVGSLTAECQFKFTVKKEQKVYNQPEIENVTIEIPLKGSTMSDLADKYRDEISGLDDKINRLGRKIKKDYGIIKFFSGLCALAKTAAELNMALQILKAVMLAVSMGLYYVPLMQGAAEALWQGSCWSAWVVNFIVDSFIWPAGLHPFTPAVDQDPYKVIGFIVKYSCWLYSCKVYEPDFWGNMAGSYLVGEAAGKLEEEYAPEGSFDLAEMTSLDDYGVKSTHKTVTAKSAWDAVFSSEDKDAPPEQQQPGYDPSGQVGAKDLPTGRQRDDPTAASLEDTKMYRHTETYTDEQGNKQTMEIYVVSTDPGEVETAYKKQHDSGTGELMEIARDESLSPEERRNAAASIRRKQKAAAESWYNAYQLGAGKPKAFTGRTEITDLHDESFGKFNPYRSRGYAYLCFPAFVFSLEKERQLRCIQRQCIDTHVKAGLSPSSCYVAHDFYNCLYIWGAEWRNPFYAQIWEFLKQILFSMLFNLPMIIVGVAYRLLCKTYLAGSKVQCKSLADVGGNLYNVLCGLGFIGLHFQEFEEVYKSILNMDDERKSTMKFHGDTLIPRSTGTFNYCAEIDGVDEIYPEVYENIIA